jgi:hypothetical protein
MGLLFQLGSEALWSKINKVTKAFRFVESPVSCSASSLTEEILIAKQLALVQGRHPVLHDCWEGWTQF